MATQHALTPSQTALLAFWEKGGAYEKDILLRLDSFWQLEPVPPGSTFDRVPIAGTVIRGHPRLLLKYIFERSEHIH